MAINSITVKVLLFLIPVVVIVGLISNFFYANVIDLKFFTLINITVIEIILLLGKWLVEKRLFRKEYVAGLLVILIFATTNGGLAAEIYQDILTKDTPFTTLEILLICFNASWFYFRGLRRVINIIKSTDK